MKKKTSLWSVNEQKEVHHFRTTIYPTRNLIWRHSNKSSLLDQAMRRSFISKNQYNADSLFDGDVRTSLFSLLDQSLSSSLISSCRATAYIPTRL